MRISDWSADVCYSDLIEAVQRRFAAQQSRLRIVETPAQRFARARLQLVETMTVTCELLRRRVSPQLRLAMRESLPMAREHAVLGTVQPCRQLIEACAAFEQATTRMLGFEAARSEEHTSELQSLMRISYAVFCLKKKKTRQYENH